MANTKLDERSEPIVIPANGYYTLEAARSVLGLRKYTLRREIRERRLRFCKRGGRILVPARFLVEWIESGEVKRPPRKSDPT